MASGTTSGIAGPVCPVACLLHPSLVFGAAFALFDYGVRYGLAPLCAVSEPVAMARWRSPHMRHQRATCRPALVSGMYPVAGVPHSHMSGAQPRRGGRARIQSSSVARGSFVAGQLGLAGLVWLAGGTIEDACW